MARPKKWRKVCGLPQINRFGPLNGYKNDSVIVMTIDEYEAIRLIDYENFTQEVCAACMSVARTTVQAIYQDARKKIATSLVKGKMLFIQGGEYLLCDGQGGRCGGKGCKKHIKGKD